LNFVKLLEDFLQGLMTKQNLDKISPGASQGAFTTSLDLPTFGVPDAPPPGLEESRDISHCVAQLQSAWPIIQQRFKERTGRDLFLTCTYRSCARQNQLFHQVPKVTTIDGITKKGRHNYWPSQAIDVCVDIDPGPGKHPVWDHSAYEPLGPICLELGLTWGGSWASLKDSPHIQI
jgi:hypothetical protein